MMKIDPKEVTVGEIVQGYINNEEQGVRGYGGLLDIRPPYQREFIYNEEEQRAVITQSSRIIRSTSCTGCAGVMMRNAPTR